MAEGMTFLPCKKCGSHPVLMVQHADWRLECPQKCQGAKYNGVQDVGGTLLGRSVPRSEAEAKLAEIWNHRQSDDASWTPKEPKRPLQEKPGAFGTKYSIPKKDVEAIEDRVQVNETIREIDEQNNKPGNNGPAL